MLKGLSATHLHKSERNFVTVVKKGLLYCTVLALQDSCTSFEFPINDRIISVGREEFSNIELRVAMYIMFP